MERLVAAEKDFRRECSFEPNTQSPYVLTFRRQGPAVRGAQNRKRSGSAPPRVNTAAPVNFEGKGRILAAADAAVSAVAEIVKKQSSAPQEQPQSSPEGFFDAPIVSKSFEDSQLETKLATATPPAESVSLSDSGAFSYRRTPVQPQTAPVHRYQTQPKIRLKPEQKQQQNSISYSSLYSRMRAELYVGSAAAPR